MKEGRLALIVGMVLTIALLHYSCQLYIVGHTQFHNVFIKLLYFPIVLSAFWFGWKGGLTAGISCAAIYGVDVVRWWNPENPFHYNKVSELFLMIGVGTLLGILVEADRRSQHAKKLAEEKAEKEYLHAITDALTGVYNRRYMEERLQESWLRGKEEGAKFSLMMVDLNHFKYINDHFGHAAGDLVLKTTAQIVKGNCRDHDLVFRFGGDEFLVLLDEADQQTALPLAKRLREEMGKITFQEGNKASYRSDFSVGVIEFDSRYHDFNEMFVKLDEALYQAKHEEDKVVLAS